MPRWHLEHAIEKRPDLVAAKLNRLGDRLRVPTCGDPGSKQRLHLRGEIQRLVVKSVEERLDAEAITGGEERAVALVPDDECELSTQVVEALRTKILVQVEGD